MADFLDPQLLLAEGERMERVLRLLEVLVQRRDAGPKVAPPERAPTGGDHDNVSVATGVDGTAAGPVSSDGPNDGPWE